MTTEAQTPATEPRSPGIAEPPPGDSPLERILAAPPRDPDAVVAIDALTAPWVVCALGERRFAFPGPQVVEILPLVPIHFVPGCPPALEGVIEVRNGVWAVLRLAALLDCPEGPVTRRAAILLGRAGGLEGGLRVDAVEDVLKVPAESFLAPPADLAEPLARVATGVFMRRGEAVLALDLERLLAAWCAGRP